MQVTAQLLPCFVAAEGGPLGRAPAAMLRITLGRASSLPVPFRPASLQSVPCLRPSLFRPLCLPFPSAPGGRWGGV
eukprot:352913-Chlamydomonas_euryale.AAC.3